MNKTLETRSHSKHCGRFDCCNFESELTGPRRRNGQKSSLKLLSNEIENSVAAGIHRHRLQCC